MNFESASRAELLEIIAQQQRVIRELQARVAELEKLLGGPRPPVAKSRPEFVKPNRTKRPQDQPRKKRTRNVARRRETPTRQVVHAVAQCRHCHCTLWGGFVKRTRQVLHVPLVPVEIIEHVFLERRCPQCGLRNVAQGALRPEVVGKHRVSASTMALIGTLREVGRLPIATIQWYLATFHCLQLSVGEIVAVLATIGQKTAPLVQALQAELRASPVVHGDETSWREDGQNGYLWTFSTATIRYFVYRRSRSGEVVTEVLGKDFEGVVVSDFYGGYNRLEGLHQRCWAHLLRDVRQLQENFPDDGGVQEWAKQVQGVYRRARDWVQAHPQAPEAERKRRQRQFEGELWQVCEPFLRQEVPQRVLCERVQRHLPELFVFVADPRVPADNNAAERSLRPVVTSRKISGGTRSDRGSAIKSALATVFGTWQVRGLNPFTACLAALTSP